MSDNNDLEEIITWKDFCLVSLWVAGIAIFYIIAGYLGVRQFQAYKAETMKLRQIRIEAATTEPGTPTPEILIPSGAQPVDVLVGIYINRIVEISFKEGDWIADFDIWFRWTGDVVDHVKIFRLLMARSTSGRKSKDMSKG